MTARSGSITCAPPSRAVELTPDGNERCGRETARTNQSRRSPRPQRRGQAEVRILKFIWGGVAAIFILGQLVFRVF